MTTPIRSRDGVWSRKGLVVEPPWPNPFGAGWALITVRLGPRRVTSLTHEHALHLRDWLSHHLGDTPALADPDAVRVEVDEQIEQLRERAATSESEDFRAGLAWAQRALTEVANAAGRKRS